MWGFNECGRRRGVGIQRQRPESLLLLLRMTTSGNATHTSVCLGLLESKSTRLQKKTGCMVERQNGS